jgi:hypothetical protein
MAMDDNTDFSDQIIERRKQMQNDIAELSNNTKILTEAVNKNTERNEGMEKLVVRSQVLTIVVLVLVAAIGMLAFGNYVRDRHDADRIEKIEQLTESNQRLSQFIESCLNPEGECRQLSLQTDQINRQLGVLTLRKDQLETAIDTSIATGNEDVTTPIYRDRLQQVNEEIDRLNGQLRSLQIP